MSATATATQGSVITIAPNRVRPFAGQPREYFDADDLIALEASILKRGQLQPGLVRKLVSRDHDFELIDGQRRWHACIRLKLPFRAIVVEPKDENDQYEMSVAANFQRADHTPLEIAKIIDRLCGRGGRSEGYVAQLFGKSQGWVSQQKFLVHLHPKIQKLIDPGQTKKEELLSVSIAIPLARLPAAEQLRELEIIQRKGLTATHAAERIRRRLLRDGIAQDRQVKTSSTAEFLRAYLVRATKQSADVLERLAGEECGKVVQLLTSKNRINAVRAEIQRAIGNLEKLAARIGGGVAPASPVKGSPAPVKPASSKAVEASVPAFVFSRPMMCPKCRTNGVRFRRQATGAVNWICPAKACELKVSNYNIAVDRSYAG